MFDLCDALAEQILCRWLQCVLAPHRQSQGGLAPCIDGRNRSATSPAEAYLGRDAAARGFNEIGFSFNLRPRFQGGNAGHRIAQRAGELPLYKAC
jgi:hypothetical protein